MAITIRYDHPMGAARIVRRERFSSGGYPLALMLADGALLCPTCTAENFAQVSYAHRHHLRDDWRPEALVILDDPDSESTCVHCGADLNA